MTRQRFLRLAALAAAGLALSACTAAPAGSAAAPSQPQSLRIVCTMFPQYDLLRAIGGQRVSLSLLVQPGMEAHGFSPTAQDMAAASQADLLVLAGGDADAWVSGILDNIDARQTAVLTLLDCLDEPEAAPDEHVWTSPRLCLQLIDALAAHLAQLDPDGEAVYAANAAQYRAAFAALDEDFAALGQAAAKPLVLADRQPFRCLAADYGLTVAAAFDGCNTDTEVSAARMAELTDLVRAQGVTTVFSLKGSSGELCRALAESTGAATASLYSGQEISAEDFAAGLTLADMFAANLSVLQEVLP